MGEGFWPPLSLLSPISRAGLGGALKKGAVGGVGSYEGVLVVNGPGVAPFLSITP